MFMPENFTYEEYIGTTPSRLVVSEGSAFSGSDARYEYIKH